MAEEASTSSGTDAFARLPPNVIELILYAADANGFASLALLNRRWRKVSESSSLYAHHLSQCASLTWATGPQMEDSSPTRCLADLKSQFLEQIRRNAFDVFLRPRRTLVRLLSSSMSSSTPFPQGEVFRFAFSTHGTLLLCISSSRIVVLEVTKDPIAVKYELQTRRRPLGATILDDGTLLAVQSSAHRINIYRLSDGGARHLQTITLNDAPKDLSFAPTGSVLALSFEDCIEVYAIGESALATERRAARCPRVDALCFSPDGSILLGSPTGNGKAGIVTITAPFDTDIGIDASLPELQMRMWTTQILFPDFIPDFSYACFVHGHEETDDGWVIAYDNSLAAFRSIKADAVNAGGVFFATPFIPDELRETSPFMLPSTDEFGELLALGFEQSAIWVYGVPARLDITPPVPEAGSASVTYLCGDHHEDGQANLFDNRAQLAKIIEQPKKAVIRGRQVTCMEGISSGRWVNNRTASRQASRRFIAVAPGGVRAQLLGQEDVPVDGGRIMVLDFERSTTNGEEQQLDIEVGVTSPIVLSEPDSSLDMEVELERRRTRLQRVETDSVVFTSAMHQRATALSRDTRRTLSQHALVDPGQVAAEAEPLGNRRSRSGEVVEVPYDNTQPRSQDTLRRAATAAASTRGHYDPRYRSSAAHGIIPHESDADDWVPPPPPYSRKAEHSLSAVFQTSLRPRRPIPQGEAAGSAQSISRSQTTHATRAMLPDRTRPHSTFLQRLGSLTGSRRTDRSQSTLANGMVEASGPEFLGHNILDSYGTPREPLMTHDAISRDLHFQSSPSAPINSIRPNTYHFTDPADHSLSTQPLPTLRLHAAEEPTHQEQAALHATILGDNYLSYSISSPNLLHIPQPSGNALDLTEEDEEADIPARQRSFRRRASTEPPSLPPPANEEWRRRIENWNEQTIRERSRKRRSKCLVM
ncbi:Uncharacterized protein PECH_006015 [Penicillium ucsense]|uniref:F-box domain-containing protein n=1 Tax=Penicillium ucsense TaxID=2839758 RepID=A0A8J8WIA1_9EURO|nr:Uncharacterized protein PECM_007480 [Penicillium ucsense]KAF7735872.1 Uncharacterized protein PECH_006015 [Penicillium ucsense]